jgi:hypothetical protein
MSGSADATWLNTAWFVLYVAIVAGYLIVDGFDLGVGILPLLVGKSDAGRRVVLKRQTGRGRLAAGLAAGLPPFVLTYRGPRAVADRFWQEPPGGGRRAGLRAPGAGLGGHRAAGVDRRGHNQPDAFPHGHGEGAGRPAGPRGAELVGQRHGRANPADGVSVAAPPATPRRPRRVADAAARPARVTAAMER